MSRRSYLYFIAAGPGPVKVGYGHNPWGRMRTFQTGHYQRLQMLGVFLPADTPQLEADLHRAMAPWRLTGEWFERERPIAVVTHLLWQVEERGGNCHSGSPLTAEDERCAIRLAEGLIEPVDLMPPGCREIIERYSPAGTY